jgi:GMP synthase (glutamine-hydrolysing)
MAGDQRIGVKTVLAIRHVAFENLGAFEAPLIEAGYRIDYADAGLDNIAALPQPDLLVVLGGPIGAYEDDLYPFLKEEIVVIAARLGRKEPILGICLGAQLVARALGTRAYPGRAKEIGWQPLHLTVEGAETLAPLKDLPVLHWHGDTFDLPDGAINLARTEVCEHQAFSLGSHVLAFQFHPEAHETGFEQWLIGHACEIAATPGVTIPHLRADTKRFAAAAARAGQAVIRQWIDCL